MLELLDKLWNSHTHKHTHTIGWHPFSLLRGSVYQFEKSKFLWCADTPFTKTQSGWFKQHEASVHITAYSNKQADAEWNHKWNHYQHVTVISGTQTASSPSHTNTDCLDGLVVKASALRAEDPGFESGLQQDFLDWVIPMIPVTQKLALQWLPCQAPGIIGSALGLVGLVSVYCEWMR